MTPRATIDFETRSACPLKKTGAWRYSLDPTTDVLCLAYRLPHWEEGKVALWTPGFPDYNIPEGPYDDDFIELLQWIHDGHLVEAHNAFFERSIWINIMAARHGWPDVDAAQWRCSAAKAAACALPRKLEDANAALGLGVLKSAAGHKVMQKMTKPRKPRKAEREAWEKTHGTAPHPTLWWESAALYHSLFDYCMQDVLAEDALSKSLPDLSQEETLLYLTDQMLNERGFQLDMEAVDVALRLIARETWELNQELATVTGGKVKAATQRKQLVAWLQTEDVFLPDTQKDTISGMLSASTRLTPKARRALEILQALGKSSTAKYEAMRYWASPVDGRVRGGLLFHGATTGRWSGSGVQPHNFPKGTLKVDMDVLWRDLKTEDRPYIVHTYKGVMEPLSHGLRGAIVAGPGKELFVADFASIEARVLLWLAGDEAALDLFRSGADIYCEMASSIYNRPITKADKDERQLGKAAVLGCGYQMGASKFVDTALMYGVTITEQFSVDVVDAYRTKFYRVKNMWYAQEQAACEAVESGRLIKSHKVKWYVDGDFLFCELPSGRRLAYPFPEVRPRATPWGDMKPSLTYKGMDPYTRQWRRQVTYGGMLVENITQAVARDLMADAILRCEASVYTPVLSVHDEVISEAPLGEGSVEQFVQLVRECPTWAAGCPVDAEGWKGPRYHK